MPTPETPAAATPSAEEMSKRAMFESIDRWAIRHAAKIDVIVEARLAALLSPLRAEWQAKADDAAWHPMYRNAAVEFVAALDDVARGTGGTT